MSTKRNEPEYIKKKNRKKKRAKKRKIRMIISGILIVLALCAIGLLFITEHMFDQINYIESDDETIASAQGINGLIPNQLDRVINIVLIGEEAMNDDQGRSDSMMLATINPEDGSLKITSMMRDMYVDIPGYGKSKLNAAFHYGGGELLVETISQTFDIDIDGYIKVDFDSFEEVIDELGGVEITLTADEAEYLNTTNYISDPENRTVTEGVNLMNGNQALGYCRVRYETASDGERDDFGRTYRQRQVLEAIFDQYKSSNPLTMYSIGSEIMSYLTTDITKQELVDYMATALACKSDGLETFRIPVSNGYTNETINGADVLVIDQELNTQELKDFINGVDTEEDSTEE